MTVKIINPKNNLPLKLNGDYLIDSEGNSFPIIRGVPRIAELENKITKIFETKGEDYFRKMEENITLKILKKNKCVISLGGGAFLNKNIKNEILNNHISFWLNWSPRILVERIKNSKKRPIAFNSTNNELIELIKKRSITYSKALYKIDCDKLTKNEITNKVLDIYEAY